MYFATWPLLKIKSNSSLYKIQAHCVPFKNVLIRYNLFISLNNLTRTKKFYSIKGISQIEINKKNNIDWILITSTVFDNKGKHEMLYGNLLINLGLVFNEYILIRNFVLIANQNREFINKITKENIEQFSKIELYKDVFLQCFWIFWRILKWDSRGFGKLFFDKNKQGTILWKTLGKFEIFSIIYIRWIVWNVWTNILSLIALMKLRQKSETH